MSDMPWVTAALWSAAGLLLICIAIVVWCVMRDRALRGKRISNGEIQRENVTITLPSFALQDFKNRSYGDTQ